MAVITSWTIEICGGQNRVTFSNERLYAHKICFWYNSPQRFDFYIICKIFVFFRLFPFELNQTTQLHSIQIQSRRKIIKTTSSQAHIRLRAYPNQNRIFVSQNNEFMLCVHIYFSGDSNRTNSLSSLTISINRAYSWLNYCTQDTYTHTYSYSLRMLHNLA